MATPLKKKNGIEPAYMPAPISSTRDMMERANREAGEKTAYMYRNDDGDIVSVTFASFYEKTQKIGSALTNAGFGKSHIACVGANTYSWITVFLAALMTEGVFVPVDRELPAEEMSHVLCDSDAEVLFYDEKYESFILENREKFPRITKFIGFDRSKDEGDLLSFREFIKTGNLRSLKEYQEMKSDPNELKLLVYTSGTTGVAKGVMLTENNYIANIYWGLQKNIPQEVGMSVLPYHHTYESVCNILVSIHYHSTICINTNLRDVSKNLKLYKPQYIYLVPAFMEQFYKTVKKNIEKQNKTAAVEAAMKVSNAGRKIGIDKRRELFKDILEAFGGRLEMIVCGGAPIRGEIVQFFDSVGVNVVCGYGITECSPLVSFTNKGEVRADTVGTRLGCLEWKIDEPNEEGIGEILVKGDNVMKGYYKNPEKTAEVLLEDGWFRTGDYGFIAENEELTITGRKKNIIVLANGKNIYPEEIEGYIQTIPYVTEVVVKGNKNEHNEEIGLIAEIYCEKMPESVNIRDDVAKVLLPLARYKRACDVVLRDEPFPKTTTAKIKR